MSNPNNLTEVTAAEESVYLVAIGTVSLKLGVRPNTLFDDISKEHFRMLATAMESAGIEESRTYHVYETCSGKLFGKWP